ncbi:hypothetical protein GCM10027290_67450 [Micromonospora sonneratiae]|uniref:S-adenosylmethionine decarboxylase n=1 Tax=Micromonospora sonneratiae TaxID=1184706 RepID=A0ABW3YQB7_9ACTN
MIHSVYDLPNCDRADASGGEVLDTLLNVAGILGLTPRTHLIETLDPQGVACVVILDRGYMVATTQPGQNFARVDILTPPADIPTDEAIHPILRALGATAARARCIPRMLPGKLAR